MESEISVIVLLISGMMIRNIAEIMPSTRITLSARHTGRFALRRNASLRRRFPCAPSLFHSFSCAFRSSFMINATQNPARNGDKILYSPPSNASSTGKFTSAKIKSAVNTIISKICFMFSLANFIRSLPSFIKKVYHIPMDETRRERILSYGLQAMYHGRGENGRCG